MRIAVPYHLHEYLPDLDLPLVPDRVITAELPAGTIWDRLDAILSPVAAAVSESAGRGEVPVVASADCTTSLGIVAGLHQAGIDAGIVWLDAHGDVQTLETSTSGYIGGLPLRLLAGHRPGLIATRLGLRQVPEHQITLVGARDLDPPEVTYLAGAAIRQSSVEALQPAALPEGPLYVHLDVDVINPGNLPGLRVPAPGGPGPRPVADALRMLLGTGRVAAFGLACTWLPGHSAAATLAPYLSGLISGTPPQ